MCTDRSLPPRYPEALSLLALTDAPVRGEDDARFLRRLTQCVMVVPHVQAAACSLSGTPDRPRQIAASNDSACKLERAQAELGEGPCHDTWRTSTPLTDIPMAHPHTHTRWPRFSRRALEAGFTAVTALPIRQGDRAIGSLILYHQRGSLHPEEVRWCRALATAAAVGLAHRKALDHALTRGRQLQTALDSRVVIEQAKGILTERLNCSVDDAFTLLRHHARRNQIKLTDLARQIVDSPPTEGPFPRPAQSCAR
ncbi:GAF and ANTAR domain-containing protein [Streptomyces sp. E11-3]|uniref:ANTAR domain-containing response regulator n=1 Tax=Streptomyces sp. E11-3 TaxID=3110112 RepID=UPI00397F6940